MNTKEKLGKKLHIHVRAKYFLVRKQFPLGHNLNFCNTKEQNIFLWKFFFKNRLSKILISKSKEPLVHSYWTKVSSTKSITSKIFLFLN